ncbi:hypothetical protein EI555_007518 [Monodon monoceros]|uniref:Tyrosine specific protein phosphatases domain-containing protein n=1 Tax=Monodon monoceros TaxID=40151 RepID=A0A4U1F3C2_MONMO|nr:hypothetical protein EI555_007518 [Monodon monoceros]
MTENKLRQQQVLKAGQNVFPPWISFNKIQEQNEELGLIIDLPYTRRYYKPEDLPETIPYLKICTIGHQVPDDDTIFKFQCAVNGFLKDNKDNDTLIGAHCTHGLNRTGYLNCRQTYWCPLYPWYKQDWLPHLQIFDSCRRHVAR